MSCCTKHNGALKSSLLKFNNTKSNKFNNSLTISMSLLTSEKHVP